VRRGEREPPRRPRPGVREEEGQASKCVKNNLAQAKYPPATSQGNHIRSPAGALLPAEGKQVVRFPAVPPSEGKQARSAAATQ